MGVENGANGNVSIKTQLNCMKIRIFVNSETELSTQMVSFLVFAYHTHSWYPRFDIDFVML